MSDLHQILQDYLSVRRSLGFKLEREGSLLPAFVTFLDKSGSAVITSALALAWAKQPAAATTYWWAARLSMVRTFARYAHTLDPRTEIPPHDVLPRNRPRLQPYIYSDADVAALMAATCRISDPFRAHTYRTLLGLLASTGMRVGEAINLDRTDLEPEEGIITVRDGKFGKSREVPLHPTSLEAIEDYAKHRNRCLSRPVSSAFFLSLAGSRLFYQNVHETFLRLVRWAGLTDRKPRRPRIHDLRHTFAVRTITDAYRAGLDVERQLPALSTYLGHVNPSSTYWYLSAVPELLGAAAGRLEASLGELP
ncbi:MAG: tyrosine-type recombinase/integrase [Deltaproteobacteria bacterium]|nr:tyrosine-type recombinase/integrase [Deltaproteobacteria bacterium]